MATHPLLSKQEYSRLLADVRKIIRVGAEEAERVAAQVLVESYWAVGKRIAKDDEEDFVAFFEAGRQVVGGLGGILEAR